MVRYVTKEDIADDLEDILLRGGSFDGSSMPILAFDNEETTLGCPNCKQKERVEFQYNIACAAGTDRVVFDWNVDLERLYITGYCCKFCGETEAFLHELSPENDGELILEREPNQ